MARNMTQRGKVDLEGLRGAEVQAMKDLQPPADMPFRIGNMGHAVLVVRDIDASVRFYTQVLGFKVSDVYPESMVPGRMVFMRFNQDHHGLGLIGQAGEASAGRELHHLAFEVPTLDDVFPRPGPSREARRPHRFPGPQTGGLSGVGGVPRPRRP